VLIEVYTYTKRKDFVHPDFGAYYSGLLHALERLLGIRLSHEGLSSTTQRVFWMHFEATVRSLLRITTPWDGYIEDSLLNRKLDESGETGKEVYRAGAVIHEATKASEVAHREILYALFVAIFGECRRVVTSEELREAGFDDSKEPDISNYNDYF
jgi:hypothetical protein